MNLTPLCPYCKQFSVAVSGNTIYPHRPDLYDLKFYLCSSCDAYVGTHKATGQPLGRLANAELRKAKSAAHRAFDPIWRISRLMNRSDAYKWLANQMNLSKADCHIGYFNVAQCDEVVKHSQRIA